MFVTAVGRPSAHLAALPEKEQALLDTITPAPLALDKALKTRMQFGTLNRLVSRGLVMLSAVTPTDASHVLGTYNTWDKEAAELGLEIYAARKDGLGQPYMAGAKELARFIIDTLELTSAEALLTQAMHDDGHDDAGPALFVLRQLAAGREPGLVEMTMKLSIPVIGLGASAPIYYPGVTKLLRTEAVIPEHAGVANAVGAVVGQVRITRDALVTQPEEGRYRIFLGAADSVPKDFANLDAALGEVHTCLEEEVRRSAETAGAGDISVKFTRADKMADIEGKQTLIEAHISATASGRPRIAT